MFEKKEFLTQKFKKDECPNAIKQLMEQCFNNDREKRPTFGLISQIIEDNLGIADDVDYNK